MDQALEKYKKETTITLQVVAGLAGVNGLSAWIGSHLAAIYFTWPEIDITVISSKALSARGKGDEYLLEVANLSNPKTIADLEAMMRKVGESGIVLAELKKHLLTKVN